MSAKRVSVVSLCAVNNSPHGHDLRDGKLQDQGHNMKRESSRREESLHVCVGAAVRWVEEDAIEMRLKKRPQAAGR